jgi:hypothetical protein
VCQVRQEFELDEAVTQLINSSAFNCAGLCPYEVIASHLVAGLVFGPEVIRARSAGRYRVDPVEELKAALKRIRRVLYATGLPREDIEAFADQGERWNTLYGVLSAERALERTLAMFQSSVPLQTGHSSRGGRTGALHILAAARAMALAWRVLTGKLPAKSNKDFHGLLSAAVATVFGHPAKEPNWEAATRRAIKSIKKDMCQPGPN